MSESMIRSDLSLLTKYIKNLQEKKILKVGILSKKNSRSDIPETNANIGFLHEFGSLEKMIPPRSFLRMPLNYGAKKIIKKFGKIAKKEAEKGDLVGLLKKLGIICEAIIQEAFESGGFGKWARNAPATIMTKGSSSPLIDTGQLRKSIGSKVE